MIDFAQRRTLMVDTQVRPSDVTKFPIIEAMLHVPREAFVPAARREAAYAGDNVDLGAGRVVLDARTLAKMLDAIDVQPGEKALDIGTGYGYAAAVLAELGAETVALESDPALAEGAAKALKGIAGVTTATGPLAEGVASAAPFDVILLGGAIEVLPEAIEAQLAEGGRIGAVFMEGALGTCKIGYKIDGAISWRFAFNASAPVLPGFERPRSFML